MRPPILLALVLASLLLAGCTRGGESREPDGTGTREVERETYDGGKGLALSIENRGTDRFIYTLTVLDAEESEKATREGELFANDTEEQWWSLAPGTYDVRMRYTWQSGGTSRSGSDAQSVDLTACPEVTRLAWRLMQVEGNVGSAFLGSDCVTPE